MRRFSRRILREKTKCQQSPIGYTLIYLPEKNQGVFLATANCTLMNVSKREGCFLQCVNIDFHLMFG